MTLEINQILCSNVEKVLIYLRKFYSFNLINMQFLRRSFLKKFGQGFAALSLGAVGAQSYAKATAKQEFYHQVFFWMKDLDNKEEQATFLKNLKTFLKACDKDKLFVQKPHIGTPAQTPRDVVDNSYGYSLVCVFKNKEDQDIYQAHAAHKKFIEDTSMLWEKVIVYDSLTV